MKPTAMVLTLGYERRTLADCIDLLRAASVHVVLDVRQTAWSHKPGFSKGKLAAGLTEAGIQYLHLREAGNPKELRQKARSHAECLSLFEDYLDRNPHIEEKFDGVVRELLLKEQRIALLCFERHPEDCHRGILATRWAARHQGRSRDLAPDGCARLVRL